MADIWGGGVISLPSRRRDVKFVFGSAVHTHSSSLLFRFFLSPP